MSSLVCLAVEMGSRGDASVNRHLGPFIQYLHIQGKECRIAYWGGTDRSLSDSLVNNFPGVELEPLAEEDWPDQLDAIFPDLLTDGRRIKKAFISGVKVFQNSAEYSEADFNDFIQGYLDNAECDWYARLFPEPVHVADWSKLDLGLGCTINPRSIILNAGLGGEGGKVVLGRASHIGADALLNLGPTDFLVGKFTMISANFAAHAMRHSMTHISNFAITKGPFSFFGDVYDKALPIRIGNDVWIGEGVRCLSGVEVPNGCVIGAGSVVTSQLEPYGVYAGNPARLIRYRFDQEKIEVLNELAWWDLEFDHLKEIQERFRQDITQLSVDGLKRLF